MAVVAVIEFDHDDNETAVKADGAGRATPNVAPVENAN
jgi:hypothetical protein